MNRSIGLGGSITDQFRSCASVLLLEHDFVVYEKNKGNEAD